MSDNKVRIIVDSAADITQAVAEKVTVLPMTLRFGDTEYVDGGGLPIALFSGKYAIIRICKMAKIKFTNPE